MRKIRLGDAATFVNGYAFKPSQWSDKGLEIIRIQNLTGSSGKSNFFDGKLKDKYLVQRGDLLISWSATLGVYEWAKEDAWLNQHIFKVVFDKEDYDKSYFKYLILSALDKMASQVHGATMKHITKKKFDAIKVPLPPLPTQRLIAHRLDLIDRLRRSLRAEIKAYEELGESVFLEMFGDPVVNEKGWEASDLGGLSKIITKGASPKWQGFKYESTGVRFITSENVRLGYLDISKDKFVAKAFHEKLHRSQLKYYDLLVNLVGASIGRGALVSQKCLPANINQAVAKIELDLDAVAPQFLLQQVVLPQMQDRLIGNSVEGARANISLKNVREFKVICPPLSLQHQFADRIRHLDGLKARAEAALGEADDLFNGVLQEVFR